MATTVPTQEMLWGELHAAIDEMLDQARPDRSSPRDRSWMQPIMDYAANRIPNPQMIIRHTAERVVIARERDANRRANRYLRDYALGQWPLSWLDLGPLPFTLDERDGLRVRFDAASPADFETHAHNIRARAQKHYDGEIAVAVSLEELAVHARQLGLSLVCRIGDLPLRGT